MDWKVMVLLMVCCLIGAVIGYLVGKHSLKSKGSIVYEMYKDEEDKDRVRCTFQLDLDIDEIVNENYILLSVLKDKNVVEYFKNET